MFEALRAFCFLVPASILHELAEPQPNINPVKVEHPAYYCNSYQDQSPVVADRSAPVDAMVVSATYCEYAAHTHTHTHMYRINLFVCLPLLRRRLQAKYLLTRRAGGWANAWTTEQANTDIKTSAKIYELTFTLHCHCHR